VTIITTITRIYCQIHENTTAFQHRRALPSLKALRNELHYQFKNFKFNKEGERAPFMFLPRVATSSSSIAVPRQVPPKISREVISQNGYTASVASFSPPTRTISTHRTLALFLTLPRIPRDARRSRRSLKLFRNEISRRTKRDYGETFCSCRARARYIKLSAGGCCRRI